ncbi:beta-lactamase/transpeptidase-like protein [Auricularia subglabra TFB-10046 SS5]|nr:beta-lactamase/transpeptidase-like protein [Auricularia subglabra TFB-10046 SS5]
MSSIGAEIKKILDDAVRAPNAPPGLVFGAVDRQGQVLVAEAAGKVRLGEDKPMTTDTYFAIYSVTKFITAIAAMQLVERGKLHLDKPIEKVLPEMADVPLIHPDGSLTKPKNKVTLRMLLTHTAGFAYTPLNEALYKWSVAQAGGPKNPITSGKEGVLDLPLVFEPGTDWIYGVSLDWVGEAVMRASGQSLTEYCAENIFKPLGITDISWRLTPENKARLAGMHERKADGTVVTREHDPHVTTPGGPAFEGGGAGGMASLSSLLKLFAAILNKGGPILKPETVQEMLSDQLPRIGVPNSVLNRPMVSYIPGQTGSIPTDDWNKGWGLSWLIQKDGVKATGRSPGAVEWSGLANAYYQIDPAKGVATIILAEIFPFFDQQVIKANTLAEAAVYASLK